MTGLTDITEHFFHPAIHVLTILTVGSESNIPIGKRKLKTVMKKNAAWQGDKCLERSLSILLDFKSGSYGC